MAGYNADINVRVKGSNEISRLGKALNKASVKIDAFNKKARLIASKGNFDEVVKKQIFSLNNLERNLEKAAANFKKVSLENDQAGVAARKYAQALDQVNVGLEKRNRLLNEAKKKLAFERFAKGDLSGRQQHSAAAGPKQASGGGRGGMGKGRENLMLGAGFPLLFGGGVGSVGGGVGGALLGNAMGMEGFGAQILGSAIGTMMDTAVQKAAKLGESLRTLNMDDLVDSGIRLSGELQTQVDLLTRAGELEKARSLVAERVQQQTGASSGSLQDVNNAVNILKSAWNDVVGAVGSFLGIIGAPVIAGLALIVRAVAEIFKGWNETFALIRQGAVFLGNLIPGLNQMVSGVMDGLNPALQESIAKAAELGRQFTNNAAILTRELQIRSAMPTGNTFEDQRTRAKGNSQIKLEKFNRDTKSKLGDLRSDNKGLPAADMKKLEASFMDDRNAGENLIFKDQLDAITKINIQETDLIAKIERQNELKAAALGIDQKIIQARSDDDKQLEARLEAEKEKANIVSKLMEDSINAGSEEIKILQIDEAKLALKKVDLGLEEKINKIRQQKIVEGEKEREQELRKQAAIDQVLDKMQQENNLIRAKINGTEDEEVIHQKIENIVSKIGEEYRGQVTNLVNTNAELTKQEEATAKLKEIWKSIKETIATGLTDAIMGLIDGTKSLGESLAGVAKQIASMMLQKAIFGAFKLNAEGGYERGGFQAFASGGYATKPTMGLVGEAGEDEYIIPASKMAQSMQRYSSGARGESVIPGTGQSSAGGGANAQTTVNYSGPILNFNSEEFIPKSAIGQIINSAASKGAAAGESRTMSTLRNSRSARSRIGM